MAMTWWQLAAATAVAALAGLTIGLGAIWLIRSVEARAARRERARRTAARCP